MLYIIIIIMIMWHEGHEGGLLGCLHMSLARRLWVSYQARISYEYKYFEYWLCVCIQD
ncbi:hypothetical protein HanHA300_Chr14g0507381 [Helianthus annuus]|nr:hypothetical protein HanHA300_Chr14g0507381 [Helianthus annuus]